jgi:hypothetical protein
MDLRLDPWLVRAALTLAAAVIAFVVIFVLPRRGKLARGGDGEAGASEALVPAAQAPSAAPPSGLAPGEAVEARVLAAGGEAGGASGGLAVPAPHVGLLELAREHNAGLDCAAESDLFVAVLPAEPAADLIVRCLGFNGLGAFMATCREARRAVSRAAAMCLWRECKAGLFFNPERAEDGAARFPEARALTVSKGGIFPSLAVSIATVSGGMRRNENLRLRFCKIGYDGAKALAAALTVASAAGGLRLVKWGMVGNDIGVVGVHCVFALPL